MMHRTYHVYIMSSWTRVLYTGMTSALQSRVYQHRTGALPGFSSRYRVCRLVWFEATNDVLVAIHREKQIKSWSRRKRIALIEHYNPEWVDLAERWFEPEHRPRQFPSGGCGRPPVRDPSPSRASGSG